MEYIHTESRLDQLARELAGTDILAADTEAAGFHRYCDRVCLLQVSTGDGTFIVDTLALNDLEPLRAVFADRNIEVVFHDAVYDLRLLDRDHGIIVQGLFDTCIAAQFLGEPGIGLGSLLEKYLGVEVEKKYQRADWAQRPLPLELLNYAAQDTRHLPQLRNRLRDQLEQKGRLSWAQEEFRLRETTRWVDDDTDEGYRRIKGARQLLPRQLAALREVHSWREKIACDRDVAPFRVLSNGTLLELARSMPEDLDQLGQLKGMPRSLLRDRGHEILRLLERVTDLPELDLPHRRRGPRPPPPEPDFEPRLERLKAARDRAATELGLDRGFLMPRAQLEDVARNKPATLEAMAEIPGLRNWQVEALGEALLEAAA